MPHDCLPASERRISVTITLHPDVVDTADALRRSVRNQSRSLLIENLILAEVERRAADHETEAQ